MIFTESFVWVLPQILFFVLLSQLNVWSVFFFFLNQHSRGATRHCREYWTLFHIIVLFYSTSFNICCSIFFPPIFLLERLVKKSHKNNDWVAKKIYCKAKQNNYSWIFKLNSYCRFKRNLKQSKTSCNKFQVKYCMEAAMILHLSYCKLISLSHILPTEY